MSFMSSRASGCLDANMRLRAWSLSLLLQLRHSEPAAEVNLTDADNVRTGRNATRRASKTWNDSKDIRQQR